MVAYWGIGGLGGRTVQSAESMLGGRGPHFGPGVWHKASDSGYSSGRRLGLLLGTDRRRRREPAGELVQMRTAEVPSRRGSGEP